MNKKSKNIIIILIFTIILISLVFYELKIRGFNSLIHKNSITNKFAIKSKNKNSVSFDNEEDEKELKQSPLYPKLKNNYKYPEKEKIHSKLINCINNFKTCKGEFISISSLDNSCETTKFAIDNENHSAIYIRTEKNKKPITVIYHNNKKQEFDDNKKTYRKFKYDSLKDNRQTSIKPMQLYLHGSSYNPPEYSILDIIGGDIPGFLFAYEDWNFKDTKFLNRNAYKITGTINNILSESDSGKFSLIADKETGIILEYISFGNSNKVKSKIQCTNIEINCPINENIYNKSTSNYIKK